MKITKAMFAAILCALLPFSAHAQTGYYHGAGVQGGPGGHHPQMQTNADASKEDPVLANYFAIQAALANDSMERLSEKAKALAEVTEEAHNKLEKSAHIHGRGMQLLMKAISDSAKSLSEKKDIESAREEFGKISEKLVGFRAQFGKDHEGKIHAFKCDMVDKVWLQEGEQIRNPYYGASMLRCGREI